MTAPSLCQSHPEATAELGLFAIFAACEANKAEQARARQELADKCLEARQYWWQDNDSNP